MADGAADDAPSGRTAKTALQVNTILVQTYWEIGKYIVRI